MKGSLSSAVLRFSNQDGPAIELHDKIIRESELHYVWWGWWKKEFEPDRVAFLKRLRRLAKQDTLYVALLNRKEERYYRARVADIIFHPTGNVSAPDRNCPDQYREISNGLPAWFQLTGIDELKPEEYAQAFGSMPTGETTLYEVRKDDDRSIYVYPQPSWNMGTIKAPGNLILHLSDLHFGEFHGFQSSDQPAGRATKRSTLFERVRDVVEEQAEAVGAVVVSGDLVSKAHVEDFQQVDDFLEKLRAYLKLSREHFVIVPGNHDFSILTEDSMPTVNYGHERAFRDFYDRFYGTRNLELERLVRFQTPSGRQLVFATLNSARLRGRESKEYGYVGRHRYYEMLEYMRQVLDKEDVLDAACFAVLHHHLLPVRELDVPRPNTPVSLTVDAAEIFTELQQRGFTAALHGHQHLPFFMKGSRGVFDDPISMGDARGSLTVIGCGASGASTLNPEFKFNALGLYGVSDNFLDISFVLYTDQQKPAELAHFYVPYVVNVEGKYT